MVMTRYVVFSGQSDLFWVKFLKTGFKHCYMLIHDGQRWITIDPLSHTTEFTVYHKIAADFDLPAWLEQKGLRVVAVPNITSIPKPLPWMIFTCVEAIKRLCGIRQFFIVTPWQLYQFLLALKEKENMGSLTKSAKAQVYTPPPVTYTPIYTPPPTSNPTTPLEPTDEEIKTKSRSENLLRRARGTLGTVITGFKGILGLNDTAAPRKNLLGE